MSKRSLTRRQAWRVEKIQALRRQRGEKKLASLGDNLQGEQVGLAIARYGQTIDVESQNGEVFHCFQRQNIGELVAGDNVVFCPGNEHKGIVVALLPRQTLLARPTLHAESKPLAANVTCMGIVIAKEPKPHSQLLDSYLVAAKLLGMPPLIVVNKSEMLTSKQDLQPEIDLALYEELGYPVIMASAHQARGLDAINDYLADHNSILLGQSGVGKSSLIASLLPQEKLRVGPLSEKTKLGKHTTTAAKLYHLPSGGHLIDSPGVRNFRLWKTTEAEILQGFRELQPFAGQCKFRDCQHKKEPGCAIQAALEKGLISAIRLRNYHYLVEHNGK